MWIDGTANKKELLDQADELCQSQVNWKVGIGEFLREWLSEKDHVLIRTSGSTGKPKLIELPKKVMRKSAENTASFFNLKKGSTALLCLSANYVAGKMMIVRALEHGWKLKCEEPASFPNSENEQFDFSALVPMQVENLLNEKPDQLEKISKIIVGGAPTSARLEIQMQGLRNSLFATYGMTETASHVALRPINGPDRSEYFELLPGISANQDSRGCLTIQADFLEKEIITNDLVEFEDFRKFRWLGRIDNVINSGGVKIIPEQVEKKIESLLDRRFYISSKEDETLGQKVILNLESSPLDKSTEKLLWSELKATLDKFEVPKEIVYHNQFQETRTGKLKRI